MYKRNKMYKKEIMINGQMSLLKLIIQVTTNVIMKEAKSNFIIKYTLFNLLLNISNTYVPKRNN